LLDASLKVGEDEEDEEEDEDEEDEDPQSSHVGPLVDTPTALPPGAPAATTGTFPNPPSPPKAPPVCEYGLPARIRLVAHAFD
jgi:hypothetical protein